ncbi:hypothetical protein [Marivirga lumbricoides]|uniref:hypothetical protein n=1 Tax=Marivirga lumbricoides TaxID=1046115 RepID=UPI00166BE363
MKKFKKITSALFLLAFLTSSAMAYKSIDAPAADREFDGNDCCSGLGNCLVNGTDGDC